MIFVFHSHIVEFCVAVLKKLDTIIVNQDKLLVQMVDDDIFRVDLVLHPMVSLEQLELFDQELGESFQRGKPWYIEVFDPSRNIVYFSSLFLCSCIF